MHNEHLCSPLVDSHVQVQEAVSAPSSPTGGGGGGEPLGPSRSLPLPSTSPEHFLIDSGTNNIGQSKMGELA